VPLAAARARAAGLPGADEPGWALVTPTHWSLGTEQVSLFDPLQLGLDEAASRAFHAVVGELFTSEGYAWHWQAPTVWLCRHPELAALPTASLDRVIGRNIDRWLTADTGARRLRRLQNEAQMLLHGHALNEAREARGALPLNSLWVSGTGELPAGAALPGTAARCSEALRPAALADDGSGWLQALADWDAGEFQDWAARHGSEPAASLTLCGERHAWAWPAGDADGRGWASALGGWWRARAGARPASLAGWLEPL
jgi:hypothetical protein